MKLGVCHIEILRLATKRPWSTAGQLYAAPARIAPLVRAGYLSSAEQSERVRGERRMYWRLYAITEAGKAILAKA